MLSRSNSLSLYGGSLARFSYNLTQVQARPSDTFTGKTIYCFPKGERPPTVTFSGLTFKSILLVSLIIAFSSTPARGRCKVTCGMILVWGGGSLVKVAIRSIKDLR